MELDREQALLSTSMGAGQIMGFNHRGVGYNTVEEMYESFKASITNQLMAVALFILEHDLGEALRQDDYLTFARIYNGPGQAGYYAKLLQDSVAILEGN